MARVLQLQRSFRSLSKPQVPIASLFPTLIGAHGRYNTRVSNILQDREEVSTNKYSPYGLRTIWSGKDLYYKKFASCNAQEANDLIREVDGWKLLNEGGKLKLSRSWRVKNLSKGVDFLKLLSGVVDADGRWSDLELSYTFRQLVGWRSLTYKIRTNEVEGISSYLDFEFKCHILGWWNTVTIVIWTEAVEGLTKNDLDIALKINKVDPQHLLSRTSRFLDLLKRKTATISA